MTAPILGSLNLNPLEAAVSLRAIYTAPRGTECCRSLAEAVSAQRDAKEEREAEEMGDTLLTRASIRRHTSSGVGCLEVCFTGGLQWDVTLQIGSG